MRIAGVELSDNKPIYIALTALYGVGRRNVVKILSAANIEKGKRVHQLSNEEIARIAKAIENCKIEGDLRREIAESIKRLRDIGSYRGMRHSRSLPARGQRTRSNARTKRGKRVTIGALKKEAMTKVDQIKPSGEKGGK